MSHALCFFDDDDEAVRFIHSLKRGLVVSLASLVAEEETLTFPARVVPHQRASRLLLLLVPATSADVHCNDDDGVNRLYTFPHLPSRALDSPAFRIIGKTAVLLVTTPLR